MTQTLRLVWKALEATSGEAPLYNWKELSKDEFRFIKPFLVPTNNKADSLHCPVNCMHNCSREVCLHDEDYSKVIVSCGCVNDHNKCGISIFPVLDVIYHEIHWNNLSQELARLLGIDASYQRIDSCQYLHKVGDYTLMECRKHPVYFAIPCPAEDIRRMISYLYQMQGDIKFILIVPTFQDIRIEVINTIRKNGCEIISLHDITYAHTNGTIEISCSLNSLFIDFKKNILRQYKTEGIAFIETPPHIKWKNIIIKVKDGHTIYLYYGGKRKVLGFKDMDMDVKGNKPGAEWRFMCEVLAKNYGYIKTGGDDRVRKNKSDLTKKLRNFFCCIDGEPIPADNKGYAKAKFKIFPEGDISPQKLNQFKDLTEDELEILRSFNEFANYEQQDF